MPTYEYVCESCNGRFERRQSIHDAPLDVCPSCGGHLQRVVTGGAGFFLKGSRRAGQEDAAGCTLEHTGRTCCGRDERCGAPPCRDNR